MKCKLEKCENKIKTVKSMLCEKHYYRLRRTGFTDKKIPKGFEAGAVYATKNHGSLEIVSYVNSRNVIVRFIKTNHLKVSHSCSVVDGKVKDPFYPRVFRVPTVESHTAWGPCDKEIIYFKRRNELYDMSW